MIILLNGHWNARRFWKSKWNDLNFETDSVLDQDWFDRLISVCYWKNEQIRNLVGKIIVNQGGLSESSYRL